MAKNSANRKAAAEFSPPGDDSEKVDSVTEIKIFKNMPPPPPAKRGAALKAEKWPFSKLEINDAFTIQPTADKPEPWKSFASVVNAAHTRFSTVLGQKEKLIKKTGEKKVVKDRSYSRKFRLFKSELEGKEVAVIQRVE